MLVSTVLTGSYVIASGVAVVSGDGVARAAAAAVLVFLLVRWSVHRLHRRTDGLAGRPTARPAVPGVRL